VNATFDRLHEEADRRGEPPALLIRHHLLEGVLRRVARLPAAEGFVLRGGLLTRALVGAKLRSTRDLDFVGDFPFDVDEVAHRFAPVVTDAVDDGIRFDPNRFTARGIWMNTSFPGVRLDLWADPGTTAQAVSVDIGFGDPLVPAAVWLDYPTLLPEAPVRLRVCRPETLLAWKMHGLAEMGTGWRPKDLADLWLIGNHVPLESAALPPAIEAAFVSRGCRTEDAVGLFDRPHWATKTARVRWDACKGSLPALAEVVANVRRQLAPALGVLAGR
jgi:hypothetical protein